MNKLGFLILGSTLALSSCGDDRLSWTEAEQAEAARVEAEKKDLPNKPITTIEPNQFLEAKEATTQQLALGAKAKHEKDFSYATGEAIKACTYSGPELEDMLTGEIVSMNSTTIAVEKGEQLDALVVGIVEKMNGVVRTFEFRDEEPLGSLDEVIVGGPGVTKTRLRVNNQVFVITEEKYMRKSVPVGESEAEIYHDSLLNVDSRLRSDCNKFE